ncbi:Imm49 family immunity protein [Streptomyces rubiginosohelvolus]|uniref:Imm49 family immunity protein n=1 Tax=Streptomyces rubiginosohelvolus TaxID=67362 RepID=UPI0037B7AF80
MREVTCHEVDALRLDEVSEDIVGRTVGRWHGMRYDDPAPRRMRLYLTEVPGHQPRHWPTVTLRKPDDAERAQAAAALDAAGALPSDQRLLRVLLDDQQGAFEQALADRLDAYRDSVGPAPAPRSLLPLDTLALAALAVQVHGWDLGVRSGYLPAELLGSPDALRRAAESESNNLGPWYAK